MKLSRSTETSQGYTEIYGQRERSRNKNNDKIKTGFVLFLFCMGNYIHIFHHTWSRCELSKLFIQFHSFCGKHHCYIFGLSAAVWTFGSKFDEQQFICCCCCFFTLTFRFVHTSNFLFFRIYLFFLFIVTLYNKKIK